MGQKSNPTILRLGRVKQWNSKYVEKKNRELPAFLFKDFEIKKFISQMFTRNALDVQACRVYYSESSLHVYVSYYNSANSLVLKQEHKTRLQNKKNHSELFKTKIAKIRKATLKKQIYLTKLYQRTLNNKLKKHVFQNQYLLSKKSQRLKSLEHLTNYTNETKHKTLRNQTPNIFSAKILKGLCLFIENKQNVCLNLKQINNERSLLREVSNDNKSKIKEISTKLRKFHQNEFFKKGSNIIYNFMLKGQDAEFLARFIAFYLRKIRRPKFFLRFLKISLKTIATKNFSKFERIRIKIKGRLNGAPRSRHEFINIGRDVPTLSLNSKIEYGESTAYTPNGTFGVKVWTYTIN